MSEDIKLPMGHMPKTWFLGYEKGKEVMKQELILEFVEDLKEININDGEEPYDLVLLRKKWEKKLI